MDINSQEHIIALGPDIAKANQLSKKQEVMRPTICICLISKSLNMDNSLITDAQPMSMLGPEDDELAAVINEISNHFKKKCTKTC